MSIKLKRHGKHIIKKEISKFEEYLGHSLPKDYRKFLFRYNGGVPESNEFYVPGLNNSSAVDRFLSIEGIIHNIKLLGNQILDNVLPIADSPCGDMLCMSIGGENYGKIYFWVHDMDIGDEELPSWKNMFLLADSFDEFMKKKLKKFDPNSIDYDSVQLEEVWLDPEFFEKIKRSALVPKKEDRSSSDSQEGYIELDDKAKKWFLENKNASKEQYEAFLMNNKHTSDKK